MKTLCALGGFGEIITFSKVGSTVNLPSFEYSPNLNPYQERLLLMELSSKRSSNDQVNVQVRLDTQYVQ